MLGGVCSSVEESSATIDNYAMWTESAQEEEDIETAKGEPIRCCACVFKFCEEFTLFEMNINRHSRINRHYYASAQICIRNTSTSGWQVRLYLGNRVKLMVG